MAEKVYLKVDVDTKEAEKNVDDLNDGLNETKTGVSDVAGAADSMTGGFIGKFTYLIRTHSPCIQIITF